MHKKSSEIASPTQYLSSTPSMTQTSLPFRSYLTSRRTSSSLPSHPAINCMSSNHNHQVLGYPSGVLSTVTFLLIFLLCFFPATFFSILYNPFSIFHSKPTSSPTMSSWFQKSLSLPSRSRGSYLVTDAVVNQLPEIRHYKVGILHLFVQHTSCALSMNENWDSDVREDMSDALDRIVPDDPKGGYRHSAEGKDDMPVSS
jgi:hypothetical protein